MCFEYKTLSGKDGRECPGGYFELYRDTFFGVVDVNGDLPPDALTALLKWANDNEDLGSFLTEPQEQLIELAAFGLVLLDRIAMLGWGRLDFERCFVLHEQLFECFDYVSDATRKVDRARRAAAARYKVNTEARRFVADEWNTHARDYDFNKSEFARHYVGLVRNKFTAGNGDPFVVTEKTIREAWLTFTPPART